VDKADSHLGQNLCGKVSRNFKANRSRDGDAALSSHHCAAFAYSRHSQGEKWEIRWR